MEAVGDEESEPVERRENYLILRIGEQYHVIDDILLTGHFILSETCLIIRLII